MNKFRNQHGAALVLTLLFITLLLLFILSQFYQITNTTKQITTIEENIDARHIAEMGIDYYQQMANQLAGSEAVETVIDELPTSEVVLIDQNRSFEINQISIDQVGPTEFNIHYTSKGIAFNKEVIETSKITIFVHEN